LRQSSDAGPIRRRFFSAVSGDQKQERFCASFQLGAQPRVRPNSPSKADLDRKSKGIRSAQERPPIQNAFGWGGWALVGMDGLCGEPSRRQHRWPVARHGADRRQVASVLLSLEGAVALALLARRGRAGSIRLCPRLGADMHATRPLRNQ